tara:strand:+ start:362 stop:529 length:168 start_codon:yes stop_codon:yes gene_type:complete
METSAQRWDFSPAVVAEESSTHDVDLGYEAALPGLQALYADAAEARPRIAEPGDH